MKHILEVLHQSFAVILFITGFLLLTIGKNSVLQLITLTSDAINSEKNIYQLHNEELNKEDIITGADLIFILKNGISCDITIDGTIVLATSYNWNYDTAAIDTTRKYQYSYQINQWGVIEWIHYTMVS